MNNQKEWRHCLYAGVSLTTHNKKGVALVYAILVLVMISILASAIILAFTANLNQINYQKKYTEAYYLAYSGIQMTFAALIADDDAGVPNDLFNQFKDGSLTQLSQDDIVYGNGTVDILVTKVNDSASAYDKWIKIRSTATLTQSGLTVTRILDVDPYDQKNTVWKDG